MLRVVLLVLVGCGRLESIQVKPIDGGAFDAIETDAVSDGNAEDAAPTQPSITHCTAQSTVVLATKQVMDFGGSLAIDQGYVYWTCEYSVDGPASIRRVPKGGGPVSIVTSFSSTYPSWGFAVDDTYAYAVTGDAMLYRAAKVGGAPTKLSTATVGSWLTVDAKSVYWTDQKDNVWQTVKDGSSGPQLLASRTGIGRGIAVDDSHVYYADWGPLDDALWRVPIGGGNAQQLAGKLYSPFDVAIDQADVFFTTIVASSGVWRVSKNGGVPTQIAARIANHDARFVVVDAANAYWTDWSSVHRTPKAGGSTTTIASGQDHAEGLAVDDDCVYWQDMYSGEILASPK